MEGNGMRGVALLEQIASERDGPFLRPSEQRIEPVDDQGYPHRSASILSRYEFDFVSARSMSTGARQTAVPLMLVCNKHAG